VTQGNSNFFLKLREKKFEIPFFLGIVEEKIANCYVLLEIAEEKNLVKIRNL